MAGLSFRAFFELLALLLPAALLAVFLGPRPAQATTLETSVNAGAIGTQAPLWTVTVGEVHND